MGCGCAGGPRGRGARGFDSDGGRGRALAVVGRLGHLAWLALGDDLDVVLQIKVVLAVEVRKKRAGGRISWLVQTHIAVLLLFLLVVVVVVIIVVVIVTLKFTYQSTY